MSNRIRYRQRARDLTPERLEVLAALRRFWETNGYAPSVRELAAELSLRSPSTVWNHLESLQRQGLIYRKPFSPRGWRLTGRDQGSVDPVRKSKSYT